MEEKIRLYIKDNLLSDIYSLCYRSLIALYDRKKSKKEKLMSQVNNMEREFKEYESSIRKLTITDIIQKGFTLEDDRDKLKNLMTKTRFFDLELEEIKRRIGELSKERTMVVEEVLNLENDIADGAKIESRDTFEYEKNYWLKMAIFQLERSLNTVRIANNQLFNINAFGIYDDDQLKKMIKVDLNLSLSDEILNFGLRYYKGTKLVEKFLSIGEENLDKTQKKLNLKQKFKGDFLFETFNNPLIDTIEKLKKIEKSFKILLRALKAEYENSIADLKRRENL